MDINEQNDNSPTTHGASPAMQNKSAPLIDRERIRGASRIIPEGTDSARVSGEQIQAVMDDAEIFIKAHKISRKDVAQAIGYSPGVVSDFIAGKYAGNKGQVAIDLESWLVEDEQRRSRPSTTQFVWTNIAMQIKATAGYCLEHRSVGMAYGPDTSGCGKTTAARAIYQELGPRRCSLVTIDKVDANPSGLIRKICAALRIGNDHARTSNRGLFERIVETLRGRSHLTIIDQAHNLRGSKDDKPFYILTDLHDATNAAQLWIGTADLVSYLERQQGRNADESLAQIRRRIFPRVDLMEGLRGSNPDGRGEPLVTIEQVREMFAKNKLKLTGTAARFLCQICNQPESGSVGLCVRLVEYATMVCELNRMTCIDLPQIKEAMRRGLSTPRAELLLQQMPKLEANRMAKVG